MYLRNPNVLTRQYRHLTNKASIEAHHITYILLDISVLIAKFGNQACMCKVDTYPYEPSEQTRRPSTATLADEDNPSSEALL